MTSILMVVVIIFTFHIGEEFGYKKAESIDHMSNGYYKAFGQGEQKQTGLFGSLFDDQTGTHGVAGKVINTTATNIIVEDNDGIEKTVIFDSKTIIRKQRKTVEFSEIKDDDFVVVIGSPNNDGKITAKIIRVLPPPANDHDQDNQTSSSTLSTTTSQ